MRAIRIINAPWGLGIGARHITVSTSGLAPQIRRLADDPLQIRLAVSLHGATDEVRNQIMPVNRRYNLEVLLTACDYYIARKKQRLTFEYILIAGVNDAEDQAHPPRAARPAAFGKDQSNSIQHGGRVGLVATIPQSTGEIPVDPART